ncbi:MAG: hypothetical protein EBR82_23550 [Caulobacteraceae bacterium]|nr:hypothetical protein [Caulobacteraceae bacterium]
MAVVSIKQIAGASLDMAGVRSSRATIEWVGVTSSNADSVSTVYQYGISNSILPLPYISYHPLLTGYLCRSLKIKQAEGEPRHWDISAEYSTEPLDEKEIEVETQPSPLTPPEISWSSQGYKQALLRDINGKPILNSAGDTPTQPLEVERSRWHIRIKVNVTAVPAVITDYADAINNGAVRIDGITFPKYSLRIANLSIGPFKTQSLITYREFELELEHRRDLWEPIYLLNEGVRELVSGELRHIMDGGTPPRPVSTPVLLNLEGQKISNPSPNNATYSQFSVYYPKSFSIFPGIL